MGRWFLRVEGVNFDDVIFDTVDLSTRRGGGLLLLDAIDHVHRWLACPSGKATSGMTVAPIALGASTGLFDVCGIDRTAAKSLADDLRVELSNGSIPATATVPSIPLGLGTFVVDLLEVDAHASAADEGLAIERLIAANRWRQLQQPTISMIGINGGRSSLGSPCELDRVRPAEQVTAAPGGGHWSLCGSVGDRRRYGSVAKQRLYETEAGLKGLVFTNDFHELATHSKPGHRLSGKIAVIHLDGNGFGAIGHQRRMTGGAAAFRRWSEGVRTHHRTLLNDLLHRCNGPDWKVPLSGKIRLETLIWGGDEILWVVPAWKGWEVVEWFLSQPHGIDGKAVTYGAGMVFCGVKAPIDGISNLAIALGKTAKGARPSTNGVAYEVLESFDDIPGELGEHRDRRLPRAGAAATPHLRDQLVLDQQTLSAILPSIQRLAASPDLPRGQLYDFVRGWRAGADTTRQRGRLERSPVAKEIAAVCTAFNDDVAFHHLLQMIDYAC